MTQLVERLLERRGIKPVGSHTESAPPQWDLSGPAAVLADAFGEVMRAGHSFDLIHGSGTPVLVLLRAAWHLNQHGLVGDDFEVASE